MHSQTQPHTRPLRQTADRGAWAQSGRKTPDEYTGYASMWPGGCWMPSAEGGWPRDVRTLEDRCAQAWRRLHRCGGRKAVKAERRRRQRERKAAETRRAAEALRSWRDTGTCSGQPALVVTERIALDLTGRERKRRRAGDDGTAALREGMHEATVLEVVSAKAFIDEVDSATGRMRGHAVRDAEVKGRRVLVRWSGKNCTDCGQRVCACADEWIPWRYLGVHARADAQDMVAASVRAAVLSNDDDGGRRTAAGGAAPSTGGVDEDQTAGRETALRCGCQPSGQAEPVAEEMDYGEEESAVDGRHGVDSTQTADTDDSGGTDGVARRLRRRRAEGGRSAAAAAASGGSQTGGVQATRATGGGGSGGKRRRQEAVEGDADGPRITRAVREGGSGNGGGSCGQAVQAHALSARALGKRRLCETVQQGASSSRRRGGDHGDAGGCSSSSGGCDGGSGSSGCSGGGSSSSHAAEVPDVRGKRHRPEEERPAARETRRRYERHEGDIDMDEEAEQRRLEWR